MTAFGRYCSETDRQCVASWSLVDRSEICRNREIRGQSGAVLINVAGSVDAHIPQGGEGQVHILGGYS